MWRAVSAAAASPTPPDKMRLIQTEADIAAGLKALFAADKRLMRVSEIAGPVPLRRQAGGFQGLASIITSQQISNAAAAAIWARLCATIDPFTPKGFLAMPEATLRTAGLSAAKIRTLTGIATAASDGFDLEALHDLPAEEAIAALSALKGIGAWTAEIYLLFCVGHPDIFPAGDLALQTAVQQGLRMRQRPDEKKLRRIAQQWSPWRGVAARLFWAYYRARRHTKSALDGAEARK